MLPNEVKYLILDNHSKSPNSKVHLNEIVEASEKFPVTFPIDTVRCKVLQETVDKESLEENINSTYPLLHEDGVKAYAKFIHNKKNYGSDVEKEFYKDFTVLKLVQKILEKRAVVSSARYDYFLLVDGKVEEKKFSWNTEIWDDVGTPLEKSPLLLQNCLSYEEMKLSGFLSVSSFTHFINNGSRRNVGKPEENRDKIEDRGVIVGLIGPKLTDRFKMEHQDIVFSWWDVWPKLMTEFYDIPYKIGCLRSFFGDCIRLPNGYYFDNNVYKQRLVISFDTFLLEANQRAKDMGTFAYVHLVGIGVGSWILSQHQHEIFLDTFAERIEELGPNLHHTSDIRLGHFKLSHCGKYSNGDMVPIPGHPKGGITIHFSKDDPHLRLKGEDEGKLLVVSFAWDHNALPGNEFWSGTLDNSSDPAAACSTQIAELHNPHINPKCSADNLHIATKSGILTFAEYQKDVRDV